MERVAFITSELGDDLVVSFAIEEPGDPTEIRSLTLLRPPKYEHLLPPEERGVSIAFERDLQDEDEKDRLEEVRYSKADRTLRLETRLRSYELDLGRVDPQELAAMRKVLRRMSRDGRLRCIGLRWGLA